MKIFSYKYMCMYVSGDNLEFFSIVFVFIFLFHVRVGSCIVLSITICSAHTKLFNRHRQFTKHKIVCVYGGFQ